MNFLGVHKSETPIIASSKGRVQKMSMKLMKLMSVHHSLKDRENVTGSFQLKFSVSLMFSKEKGADEIEG